MGLKSLAWFGGLTHLFHLFSVADYVRYAVLVEDDLAFPEPVANKVGSVLVLARLLVHLKQPTLEVCDGRLLVPHLRLALLGDSLEELLTRELLGHLGLRATALAPCLQQVSSAALSG